MRFVPTKTPEQQSSLSLHRTRHRQQTAIINSIRAHLAEFGIVAPVGRQGVEQLLKVVVDVNDTRLREIARACVEAPRLRLTQPLVERVPPVRVNLSAMLDGSPGMEFTAAAATITGRLGG